ncbi:solute carrier family 23 protein [Geobacillus thermoleovorans]|uniref:solute carrier family 23 protein n=1 Tax=Geobacillus thermoleovorans TaxID=33941 RepID=UPI002EC32970|nr:solute carrier family 23 protein [Anoxybacillus geothermalis]MED4924067.1 solute carrier family 23 protein [Anoxybacillus geothermalis]
MYAGAILVPLIVGRALHLSSKEIAYLVAIDLLTCGIATLLQAWKNKYPYSCIRGSNGCHVWNGSFLWH